MGRPACAGARSSCRSTSGWPAWPTRPSCCAISTRIGVVDSARFLRGHSNWFLRMLQPGGYEPGAVRRGRCCQTWRPQTRRVAGLHVFTFNEIEPTERWRQADAGAPCLAAQQGGSDGGQFPSDLEIARRARLVPMPRSRRRMGIEPHMLEPYGYDVAKIKLEAIEALADRPRAKYVVVSAITPTPLGEGKTTTTVGLGDALGTHRQARHGCDPPAVDGTDLRHQGRRGGRRLQPGGADGAA